MKPPKCKFNCGVDHWSPICPKPPKGAAVKDKVTAIASAPVKLGSKGKAKKAKKKKAKAAPAPVTKKEKTDGQEKTSAG